MPAESRLPLHATFVSISRIQIVPFTLYKQVAQFAPLLVDVEALLPSMRQLLRTADSPDTIVAPTELVMLQKIETDAQKWPPMTSDIPPP